MLGIVHPRAVLFVLQGCSGISLLFPQPYNVFGASVSATRKISSPTNGTVVSKIKATFKSAKYIIFIH